MAAIGYVSSGSDRLLAKSEIDLGAIGPRDVIIAIENCGVCASDLDLLAGSSEGRFPMVAGHEIVGRIASVGSEVRTLRIGDRVGLGPLYSSCGICEFCLAGRQVHCRKLSLTARPGGLGGFSTQIRAHEAFTFKIPDTIASEHAAPLLCAGLTTYTALKRNAVPGIRVGILGIGGLGHLAVQFAQKMKCAVSTFSLSPDETEMARHVALGADRVIDLTDKKAMSEARGSIDLLISTAYGEVDWQSLLRLLRPEGKICVLGGSSALLNFPATSLVFGSRSICGSAAGSTDDTLEMLRFAVDHNVRPIVERMPIEQINEAIGRVKSGTVRYRMVLDVNQ